MKSGETNRLRTPMAGTMDRPDDQSGRPRPRPRRARAGLTLVECLVASAILAVVTSGLIYTTVASHQHLAYASEGLRALRLAEAMMEEIHSRPYTGSGSTRSTWHVEDYDGFEESPGSLADFDGTPRTGADQAYARSVTVAPMTISLPELGSVAAPGKLVTCTVALDGDAWTRMRFIPEPASP